MDTQIIHRPAGPQLEVLEWSAPRGIGAFVEFEASAGKNEASAAFLKSSRLRRKTRCRTEASMDTKIIHRPAGPQLEVFE